LLNSLPQEKLAESEQEPIRVLLVDDDEDEYIITRRLISEIVGRKHLLDWAATYEQGLAAICEGRHDLYLIDYRLDGHTGIDLLKDAIQQGCTQPMILLTGQEDREVDMQAMKHGAWDYLVKGRIDSAALERSIRYTLEHKKILDIQLENQKQREKFVATLTHDLKTPIKAEYRIFELLRDGRFGPITEEQKSVINELLRSNRFMYQMVDNLLTAFKFEEGHLVLRMEAVDLNELVHAKVSMDLMALVEDKGQTLTLNLQPALPLVQADAIEITRVVHNLVQNAINYTPKGGHITVSTQATDHQVAVTVEDNGPGIDINIQKSLFEPYSSMAKRYRHIGTGLGLYISKKIVEAHQGQLLVDSQPGRGSRFTFVLPEQQPESTVQVSL
jgi:two-component system sensor histidine kinase/response regulator